jgi:ABC-type sugar transport system permease subunit
MSMLKKIGQNPYLLLLPTVLLLLVFSYYPFFSALGYAFFRWTHITRPPEWAGLDNFRELFSDGDLWRSFVNMGVLLVADVLKVLVVTTTVAELIFSLRSARLARFYRIALVLPMVVPGVVGLYIWASFYDFDTGLVNTLLRPMERSRAYHWLLDRSFYQRIRDINAETAAAIDEERVLRREIVQELKAADERTLAARVAKRKPLDPETDLRGLPERLVSRIQQVSFLDERILSTREAALTKSWLGNENTALGAFVFMGFPWCGGVAVLIVLAGLYSIPQDLFDCARVDGVGPFRRIFTIDIYLIAGQLKLLVVLAMLGTIQGFMGQMILTDGGPGSATLVPALHLIHHAFRYRNLGYGAAIAVVLFLIMLALTYINMRYIRSSEEVV